MSWSIRFKSPDRRGKVVLVAPIEEASPWKLLRMRSGVTLFGRTITPRAACHEMSTCAGVALWAFAISCTTGFSSCGAPVEPSGE